MIDEKWSRVSRVPQSYLKTIGFGSLKGKSDISPQWRIKAMTEVYGMCGIGWYHECRERWSTPCDNGEIMVFCEVVVCTKNGEEWSKPTVGFGGNKIIELAKGKPKPNDEGWKMAYSDALGKALTSLGVASEIYEGNFDGSKYSVSSDATPQPVVMMTEEHCKVIDLAIVACNDETVCDKVLARVKVRMWKELEDKYFNRVMEIITEESTNV